MKDKKWLMTFEFTDDGTNDDGDKGFYLTEAEIVEAVKEFDLPAGISIRYVGGFEVKE